MYQWFIYSVKMMRCFKEYLVQAGSVHFRRSPSRSPILACRDLYCRFRVLLFVDFSN